MVKAMQLMLRRMQIVQPSMLLGVVGFFEVRYLTTYASVPGIPGCQNSYLCNKCK